jgi:phosphatidylserine/phosphatidylglycerophosphate/cardiolipin synthase-like enzyme
MTVFNYYSIIDYHMMKKTSARLNMRHAGTAKKPKKSVKKASKGSKGNRQHAVAIANNDISIISWSYKTKIPDCLGFAIYRIDDKSQTRLPLPAWVGFKTEDNRDWQPKTTEQWPIQKFNWSDFEAPRGGTYKYEVVPMIGEPDNLKPRNELALSSNTVQLSPICGDFSAYFNRGILSTQSLVHSIPTGPSGRPDFREIVNRIDQPGDPLRNSLAGDMVTALQLLLTRAREQGGQCYCALYEFSDTEMEQLLLNSNFVHVILSNTGPNDSENRPARQALHEAGIDITDRMVRSGHIGHNKFMVYVDGNGNPQAVLTGSTNWTASALCGQSNNSIIIESSEVAKIYLDYWNRLKADDSQQATAFRIENTQTHETNVDKGNTDLRVWFAPNTKDKSKPAKNPMTPPDMEDIFDVMSKAKEAILFLAFQPGTPSIIDKLAECQQDNPNLFIRGAVTDPKAVQEFNTLLFHRSASPDESVESEVVPATAVNDQFSFWQKELLKLSPSSHAIIHDKIIVVDPFSDDCVVITGSHNLGYRASYNNDENLIIVHGNSTLARAYAAHVMDVYDHYRFRYIVQQHKQDAFTGLETDDKWQDKYFDSNKEIQNEMKFWDNA